MDENRKAEYFEKFNNSIHVLGKTMLIIGIIVLVGYAFLVGAIYNAYPNLSDFLTGILSVGLIYFPVAIVEFLVYAPMLGVGGSYLAFITGNLTNLKIPCAMNARELSGVEAGTPENEIISTLSIASSALTTMAVLAVGVLLLTPLRPVLQSEVLAPAFDNVVPALFGAFGLKYFMKSPAIAAVPLVIMSLLCIFVPSLIASTGFLVIPSGLLSIGVGYFLNKKGLLKHI